MSFKPTEKDEEKLQRGWDGILSQYKKYSEDNSRDKGPGVNIFIYPPEEFYDDKTTVLPYNCRHMYCLKGENGWEVLFQQSPDGEYIVDKYDPTKMYLICVHVTTDSHQTFGNIRMFEFDTGREIR